MIHIKYKPCQSLTRLNRFFFMESVTFSALGSKGGGTAVGGHTPDFFAAQKFFVWLMEAPQQTLCLLLASGMLDIAST